MIPPPLYRRWIGWGDKPIFNEGTEERINGLFQTLIPSIARDELNLPADQVINNFEMLGGSDMKYPFLIEDGLHPNDEGYRIMARNIQCSITEC